MADQLFGHPYVHYTQPQLKTLLNKANVDVDDANTKEALFHLAQAFELSLSERSRRILDQLVDEVVLQRKRLVTVESGLETMISRISAGEDEGCGCQEEEEETRTCEICLDELPIEDFPTRGTTENCEHEPAVCLNCLQQHIEEHMRGQLLDTLACPSCFERMSNEDVQLCATKELFDEYCRRALRTHLQSEPNFNYCLGPNCGSGQIVEDAGRSMMVCHVCSYGIWSREDVDGVKCVNYRHDVEDFISPTRHYMKGFYFSIGMFGPRRGR